MQKILGPFVTGLLLAPALFSATAASSQNAPTAQKPAGISCSIRHSPLSPGDIAFSHGEFSKAIELYRGESKVAGDDGERAHDGLLRSMLRSGKIADAETDARAWAAKSPSDSWALISVAQLDFRRGDIDKAGNEMRAALAAGFCNAQAHADYAEYLSFTGFHASAKSQIEIARKLDPVDDEIGGTWIHYQPRATRLAAVNAYLDRSKFLTDKERKSWELERDALSAPPAYPCQLAEPVSSTTIPFHGIRDGNTANGQPSNVEWGLIVMINGKPRRLEIDTGAHGLVLKRSAAASLGLEVESHTQSSGLGDNGAVATSIARVKSLKIGGLEFHDCAVDILEKDLRISDSIREIDMMGGEDGLIGGDVFQNFLLTLDFPGHLVKLDPLPAVPGKSTMADASIVTSVDDGGAPPQDRYIDPSMASWTKIFREGHFLILPVRLNGGPVKLFIVDTGAGFSDITPAAAAEVSHLEKGSAMTLMGISGEVKHVYTTGPLTLDFAGLRQPSDGMIATDSGLSGPPVELSGLLGQLTLRQLTISIDYRDQLVHFTYDPSRVTHCLAGASLDDCY